MIQIRAMLPTDDRVTISKIYETSWKHAYKGIIPQKYLDSIPEGNWVNALDQPGRYTLVAVLNDEIIGTSSYGASRNPEYDGWGEMRSIYFLPTYMGKGYGSQLMQAALLQLQQLGYQDVFLWVLEENIPSRKFYEKNGFYATGEIITVEIGGKPLTEMRYVCRI